MKSDSLGLPTTAAYYDERAKLPAELQEPFDKLVEHYRYYATVHYQHPFVSYKVLGELVRAGWRHSEQEL